MVIYSKSSKKIRIGNKPCRCSKKNFALQNKIFISREGPFTKIHSYQILECSTHHHPWGKRRKEIIKITCESPIENYIPDEDETHFLKNIYFRIQKGKIAENRWNMELNKVFSQEDIESKTIKFIQAGLIYHEEIILQSKNEKKIYFLFTPKGEKSLKQILGIKARQEIIDDCKLIIANALRDIANMKILDALMPIFLKQSHNQLYDKRIELIYKILNEQFNLLNSKSIPYFILNDNKKLVFSSNLENYQYLCKTLIKIAELIIQRNIIDTSEFSSLVKISPQKMSFIRSKIEKILGFKLFFFNIKRSTIFLDEKRKKKELKRELEQLINELEVKGRDFIVNQIIDNRPPNYSISDCWDYYFSPIHTLITDKLSNNEINRQKTSKNGIRAMLKYIYFRNIKEIINRNWNLFFKQKIPKKQDFGKKYDQLNALRNNLMHPEHQFEDNLTDNLKYAFEILQIFYL